MKTNNLMTKQEISQIIKAIYKNQSNQEEINNAMNGLLFKLYSTKQLTENTAIWQYPGAEISLALINADDKCFKMDVNHFINHEISKSEMEATAHLILNCLELAEVLHDRNPENEIIIQMEEPTIEGVLFFYISVIFQ
jgi:hypothetical protein